MQRFGRSNRFLCFAKCPATGNFLSSPPSTKKRSPVSLFSIEHCKFPMICFIFSMVRQIAFLQLFQMFCFRSLFRTEDFHCFMCVCVWDVSAKNKKDKRRRTSEIILLMFLLQISKKSYWISSFEFCDLFF